MMRNDDLHHENINYIIINFRKKNSHVFSIHMHRLYTISPPNSFYCNYNYDYPKYNSFTKCFKEIPPNPKEIPAP